MPISKLTSLPFPPPAVTPFSASGQGLVASVNQLIDKSVASLKSLPASPQTETVYNVIGFYAGSTVGGGRLVWQPSTSKSLHNGVTYYAPEAITAWNGTQADIATLLGWSGSGSGVWVRVGIESVLFEMAGAILDANPATGTGTDNTLSVNKCLATGLPVTFIKGFCKVTDRLNMVNNQIMSGSGRSASVFVISTDFNLSATGVVRLGTSEPGAQIRDVGFSFVQANQGVRANCTQYPWAIDASAIPRFILDNIRIEGAWNGVNATGNCGGASIGFMEIGALNVGMEVNGSLDFFHVNTLHFWPFGFTNKTTLLNGVYYDGVGTSLKYGLCDGADFGTISMFRTKMEITSSATAGISNDFGRIQLDGDGARLIISGGINSISQLYTTKSGASATNSIQVSAGITSITELTHIGSNPQTDFVVNGGALLISGGLISWLNSATTVATVSAGQLVIEGCKIRVNPTTVYTSNLAAQSSTGELVFQNNTFDLKTSGSGVAVSYATDVEGNYCLSNRLSGYTTSNPVAAALGVYQGTVSYIPVITGATVAGVGTYSVQDGKYTFMDDRTVFFSASITWSAHTGSGGTRISLPHNLADFGQRVPLSTYYADLTVGANREVGSFVGTSGNVLAVRALDPAGGVALEFFDTAGTINISGFYRRA